MRRLCVSCKKPADSLPEKILKAYNVPLDHFKGATVLGPGAGCPKCRGTGYKGRIAIMEVLPMNRDRRADIMKGVGVKEIAAKAHAQGVLSLKDIGLRKVRDGITSVEEALGVTGGD